LKTRPIQVLQIIAVSPDQPTKVRETIEKHRIAFTLLSDVQMTASRAYKVDDATLKLLAQNGIDLEAASGEKHHELPVPAVFLLRRHEADWSKVRSRHPALVGGHATIRCGLSIDHL
jgi:peroxiredoxin